MVLIGQMGSSLRFYTRSLTHKGRTFYSCHPRVRGQDLEQAGPWAPLSSCGLL